MNHLLAREAAPEESASPTAQAGVTVLRDEPLVSIVTPSYNQGGYIEETIRSVLQQDYSNMEYLVLDGGSTDNTLAILQRYSGRLSWISEKDQGQADAINKGFRMAKGEILAWLNSDDTYLPGTIRKVVEYFQTHHDVGMVYGEGYHIDAMGKILERYYTEPFDFQRLSEICFICQPTAFLRAEVFRALGPLDDELRYSLDYEYWMRLAKRFRIGYLSDYLANSRLHIETKTLSQRVKFHQEILHTVKRHYGRVPMRWIYAYVHGYLSEKLMPFVQGIHPDGWASQHASAFLQGDWRHYSYLLLEGQSSIYTLPMVLRIAVGDQVLHEAYIEKTAFSIKQPFVWTGTVLPASGLVEVRFDADRAFAPHTFGINDDTRKLSYHILKLALSDGQGGELVLYSERRARLFHLALPALVLRKSLLTNRRVPYQELARDLRRLTQALK
jgi:glycosyltransferase involved in cell wall biosynthesis